MRCTTKGGKVASLSWPVSVGATSIDFNLPEYWRAANPRRHEAGARSGDARAAGRAGSRVRPPLARPDGDTTPVADDGQAAASPRPCIGRSIRAFITLHLSQPGRGRSTSSARIRRRRIGAGADRRRYRPHPGRRPRKAEPDLMVAIVSDHGFAPLGKEVNLYRPFIDAGLITVDPETGKPTDWLAEPWGGASAAIVLAHPDDEALKAKVKALLDKLAADPELGIDRIAGRGDRPSGRRRRWPPSMSISRSAMRWGRSSTRRPFRPARQGHAWLFSRPSGDARELHSPAPASPGKAR